jgi:copper homeostasis protein (lipoprotein)
MIRTTLLACLVACSACGRQAVADEASAGCYTFGHEVNALKPEGSDSVFWVVGSQDILRRLRTAHDSLTSQPYEPVWVRVVARPSTQAADGFALDYSGLIEIQRVIEIRKALAGECQ